MEKKDSSDNVVPMTKLPLAPDARFADFYVPPPSRRKGGEAGVVMGFVVSEATKRDIDLLLLHHGDKFPWQTPSDFLRWATELGVTFAARCADESKALGAAAKRRMVSNAIFAQKEYAEFQHKMDQVETAVNQMLDQGHRQPVIKNLLEMKRIIKNDLGDDKYWQKVYAEEFERRFARHLKRASLSRFSEEEE